MIETGALLDPASVVMVFAALAGLVAANEWRKVWRSVDTSGEVVKGPGKREVGDAAMWTSAALFLACGGFLLGLVLAAL
jgi:predicted oxidoreductase